MVEVKADALEQSFDAIEEEEDGVAALKTELEQLKSKIAAGVIAAPIARAQMSGTVISQLKTAVTGTDPNDKTTFIDGVTIQ